MSGDRIASFPGCLGGRNISPSQNGLGTRLGDRMEYISYQGFFSNQGGRQAIAISKS